MKKRIKIKFVNGLNFDSAISEILSALKKYYDFVDSDKPDFIIFGPYGNDLPPEGEWVRVGYFCENIVPDMSICDWAFGVPYEEEVQHPRYMRIQWHGFDPEQLIKKQQDIKSVIAQKTKFCNFIYSNPVPFREEFFRKLSKYKAVDAPGKSMNNMESIDEPTDSSSRWERKRNFISQYKFTIAFENYSFSGYHTEKILDPMVASSLPIYLGNPHIDRHFNPKSFVNGHDYSTSLRIQSLENLCRPNLQDYCPSSFKGIHSRIQRKAKSIGRDVKMRLQCSSLDQLIERIIEIDCDDHLYAEYLSEPWLHNNILPSQESMIGRWREIFG